MPASIRDLHLGDQTEVMSLPAMQAQRPEPTGETIGRAIEPWMDEGGFEVFDTLGGFFF